MIGLMVAAALSAFVTSPHAAPWQKREARRRIGSIRHRAERGPNGLTFRSLKRAVNAGWTPPRPTRKAMERHAWFQKKLHGARLRISVGQELPGDRELVGS